ncbi:MAG: LysM peptidoglycan-binding domain-containing protein [Candidatus Saccharimonadales bacterium]|nr:LysM peptidoglycan-binding domain-containing protein [Candidatus Saccharimonadales bacterium]
MAAKKSTPKQLIKNAHESVKKTQDSARERAKKHYHTWAPAGLLGFIGIILFLGNLGSESTTKQPLLNTRISALSGVSAVDEVSSASIAATIATGADLIVADNVNNLADSLNAQVDFATTEEAYLAKPQVVVTDAKTSKDIIKYRVKDGETVSKIARKFNITSDTIRWANDIGTGVELLNKGDKLTILPVSGLLYTVKAGDTVKSIASKYEANQAQIIAFNDAEIDGLKKGQKIIIPNGEKPAPPPRTYFSSGPTWAFGSQPLYGGNGYSYGYCTWHAANRRAAIGRPIPRNLGNAVTWASLAASAGLSVSGTPKAGDVLWHKNTYIAGGLGHVAFVEKVNADGSIYVSDMNYPIWGGVTYRTISPDEFSGYLFIH